MIQNDVVSPTLNTNEASLGIATVGIAFQPDPSFQRAGMGKMEFGYVVTIATSI